MQYVFSLIDDMGLQVSHNSTCAPSGNAIGEDGIDEVKGWLESNGCLDTLGSMSDDEGEGDDDDDDDNDNDNEKEEEEEEEDADELGGSDSDEGEAAKELDFNVKGVSLKPQSPLLGTDEEVENELLKVGSSCGMMQPNSLQGELARTG